jgi:hypothetical protein
LLALQLRRPGVRFWTAADGYAITSGEGGSNLHIWEMYSESGGELGMIRGMLDRMRSGSADWSLPAADRKRIARSMPAACWWNVNTDWQYRIVNLFGLLDASRKTLERESDGLGDFDVSIGIREHDRVDAVTIGLRKGALTIKAGRRSPGYVELDPVSAVRLILGGPPVEACKKLPPSLLKLLPVSIHVPSLDHV